MKGYYYTCDLKCSPVINWLDLKTSCSSLGKNTENIKCRVVGTNQYNLLLTLNHKKMNIKIT